MDSFIEDFIEKHTKNFTFNQQHDTFLMDQLKSLYEKIQRSIDVPLYDGTRQPYPVDKSIHNFIENEMDIIKKFIHSLHPNFKLIKRPDFVDPSSQEKSQLDSSIPPTTSSQNNPSQSIPKNNVSEDTPNNATSTFNHSNYFKSVLGLYKIVFQKVKVMIHTLERGFDCEEWQTTLKGEKKNINIPCHYFFCIF